MARKQHKPAIRRALRYRAHDWATMPMGEAMDMAIMDAKEKPDWVSQQRWNMELARRRNPRRYYHALDGDYTTANPRRERAY